MSGRSRQPACAGASLRCHYRIAPHFFQVNRLNSNPILLVTHLLSDLPLPHRFINADEIAYREALASQSRQTLADLLGDASLLVIFESFVDE